MSPRRGNSIISIFKVLWLKRYINFNSQIHCLCWIRVNRIHEVLFLINLYTSSWLAFQIIYFFPPKILQLQKRLKQQYVVRCALEKACHLPFSQDAVLESSIPKVFRCAATWIWHKSISSLLGLASDNQCIVSIFLILGCQGTNRGNWCLRIRSCVSGKISALFVSAKIWSTNCIYTGQWQKIEINFRCW